MLLIRREQMDALRAALWPLAEDALFEDLGTVFQAEHRVLGDEGFRLVIKLGLSRCQEHDVDRYGDVRQYVFLMFLLGSHFDRDPLLKWARTALAECGENDDRVRCLVENATRHIEAAAGAKGQFYRAALARCRRLGEAELELASKESSHREYELLLRELWPERMQLLDDRQISGLLERAGKRCREFELPMPSAIMLVAVLSMMLGTHFYEDPIHPWAARALARPVPERYRALSQAARDILDIYLSRGGEVG